MGILYNIKKIIAYLFYYSGSTVPVPVGDNKKVPESMQG